MDQISTAPQRLEALRAALGDSVAAIQRAAAIFREMEEAGDDLGGVPAYLARLLRDINSNRMLPDVAVRMSGSLRAKVGMLPLPDQRRLLDPDARLEVALPNGDKIMVSPAHLTTQQIKQVFGDGFIRQPAEQIPFLGPAPRKRGREKGIKSIVIDRAAGVVDHYGHKITKDTLLKWLREL